MTSPGICTVVTSQTRPFSIPFIHLLSFIYHSNFVAVAMNGNLIDLKTFKGLCEPHSLDSVEPTPTQPLHFLSAFRIPILLFM